MLLDKAILFRAISGPGASSALWHNGGVDAEDLRLAVYRTFAGTGRAPHANTRCPACGRPLVWNVGSRRPPDGDQVAHFLVPAPRMWDDVVHTCRHQRLFCSTDCVDAWLEATGSARGYVMDLTTLWRLAAHWYDGRLERGYTRREPAQAAEYLRGVGLSGPFWGL